MKIAFIVPWITKGRGGTENVGQMMANAMAERGHTVEIFTFDDERGRSRWALNENIRLKYVPENHERVSDQQLAMAIAGFGADLIVGLHMNRAMLQYARIAKRLDLPLVISEHAEPQNIFDRGTSTPAERELSFAGATRIHLLNERLKEDLPAYLAQRVCVVPNTIPSPSHVVDLRAAKQRRTLLSVARLVPRKNIQLLLKAFATIAEAAPEWDIHIVGDGPELPKLEKRAAELGIAHRVSFAGHQDDIYPFYEKADLFTLPSISEVFGLVTLEAMAHGLPVVGLRASMGANQLIDHDVTGLLSSGSYEIGTYGDDLLRLMQDTELRASMGEASKRKYAEEFSCERVYAAYEDMFRDAVSSFKPAGRPDRRQYVEARLDDLVFGDLDRIKDWV